MDTMQKAANALRRTGMFCSANVAVFYSPKAFQQQVDDIESFGFF
jgi:hypothetical protein